MRYFILLLSPLFLTGCFSTTMLDKAARDRKPQKVYQIQDAWEDTASNIIVNFTAKLSGKKRNVPAYMIIPVNTLMRVYLGDNRTYYALSPGEKNLYGVNRIHPVLYKTADSLGKLAEIECLQEKVQEGHYAPRPSDIQVLHRFRLPVKPHKLRYKMNWNYYKQKRILLLYQPDTPYKDSAKIIQTLLISVEPSHQRKYSRYLLTPLTVSADLVTIPFQFGMLFLLPWAIRY
ncbi:MAG: hypothetical protein J7578_06005 [Chitinophagaceae bacterium]|nr:hypothetical protein [Chitinophagaceae bacterium]